jgi:Tfp pilus assembly protein PilO
MQRIRDQLITGVLVAGLVGGGFGLLIQPQRRQLAAAREQVRTLETEVAVREQQGLGAVATETHLQQCRQSLARLQGRIPADPQLGPLLEKLDHLASETGLREQNVTPHAPSVTDGIGMVSIDISFESSFSALYAFLEGVESLDRLVRVAALDTDFSRDDPGVLVTTLTLEVYFEAA